jgi:NADH:ubiquinone oxidoreductase subunit 6 (subunit J)
MLLLCTACVFIAKSTYLLSVSLVLAYASASLVLFMCGQHYLAVSLILVYLGALLVLFLFAIMLITPHLYTSLSCRLFVVVFLFFLVYDSTLLLVPVFPSFSHLSSLLCSPHLMVLAIDLAVALFGVLALL